MVMFAVIDIIGSIPIIVDLKTKGNKIYPFRTTLFSFLILITFLFLGEAVLGVFGVDIESFAIAGSFVLFFLAMEMILGIEIFRGGSTESASIVPLAFPIIAGAGSITSILSLKAEYGTLDITLAVLLNMVIVYFVLKTTGKIEKIIGKSGIAVLRKFFGIILLSISIKLFMSNIAKSLETHLPGLLEKL
jgi:multiple antibiotic resistance protein